MCRIVRARTRTVRINILLNRALVVDLRRSAQGEVHALGHDIEPRSVLPALNRAAVVMRRMLHERGADLREVDKELEGLAALGLRPAEVPADWRRAAEILRNIVYRMGERLCTAGEDAVDIEIADEQTPARRPN
jgi:hypothetical protein